jgi:hypothetical protein
MVDGVAGGDVVSPLVAGGLVDSDVDTSAGGNGWGCWYFCCVK